MICKYKLAPNNTLALDNMALVNMALVALLRPLQPEVTLTMTICTKTAIDRTFTCPIEFSRALAAGNRADIEAVVIEFGDDCEVFYVFEYEVATRNAVMRHVLMDIEQDAYDGHYYSAEGASNEVLKADMVELWGFDINWRAMEHAISSIIR